MKIYTYYEDINHASQEKLINLWHTSWRKFGFDPVVLTKNDAKKHSFYEEFTDKIKKLHIDVMNKPISNYGLACYLRWLSYASMENEFFYVSDYDCINNGLMPNKIVLNCLHLMDDACPCFASGNPTIFENLCKIFISVSNESIERLQNLLVNSKWYHDQEFFQYNFSRPNPDFLIMREKHNIHMTRDRKSGVGPYIEGINTCKVLHVSHHNAQIIKKSTSKYSNLNMNETRIKIIQDIVS